MGPTITQLLKFRFSFQFVQSCVWLTKNCTGGQKLNILHVHFWKKNWIVYILWLHIYIELWYTFIKVRKCDCFLKNDYARWVTVTVKLRAGVFEQKFLCGFFAFSKKFIFFRVVPGCLLHVERNNLSRADFFLCALSSSWSITEVWFVLTK